MEVAAHAHQPAPGWHGGEELFMQTEGRVDEVLHAIRLGEEAPTIKRIDVHRIHAGLVTADEVAGQTDAGDGHFQAAGQQEVDQTEADGIPGAAVEHLIEVTILRVEIAFLVATKTEFGEQVLIDDRELRSGFGLEIEATTKLFGKFIKHGAVSVGV